MSSVKLNYAELFRITKHLYILDTKWRHFLIIQYIFTLEGNKKWEW